MSTETVVIKSPSMYGGISRQPPTLRFPNQVEEADNAVFSVIDGMSKRPGSRFIAQISGLTADVNYRLHRIRRDENEEYLVLYGGASVLRVFNTVGSEIPVTVSAEAQTYLGLNSATADDLRFVTIADYTLVLNTTVALSTSTSDTYAINSTWHDYDDMIGQTPATGTYHKTKNGNDNYASGYWQYDPGNATFAVATMNTVGTTWVAPSNYSSTSYTPYGYKILFTTFPATLTSVSWTVATKTITKAGGFASYVWKSGDRIAVTGGTGVTAGFYEIASKTSDDAIVLVASIAAGNNANTTTDGVGDYHEVSGDHRNETFSSMREVAQALQQDLRNAGAVGACIGWKWNTNTTGHFEITSPYCGTDATFPADPTLAPASGVDYSISTRPFYSSSVAAGTGVAPVDTVDVLDRWIAVPAPDQAQAVIDADTMPIKIVRQTGGYQDLVKADGPFAYWRLEETSGTTAAEEVSGYDGTYVGSPTLEATGALVGETSKGVTLDGSSTKYISLTTLGALGVALGTGFTFEAWIKSSATVQRNLFTAGGIVAGGSGIQIYIEDPLSGDGSVGITVQDDASAYRNAYTNSANNPNVNDGSWHHVVVTVVGTSATIHLYVDGVERTLTDRQTDTLVTFTAWSVGAVIGNSPPPNTPMYEGTIDEVAVYDKVLDQTAISRHYNRGAKLRSFEVDAIEWNSRTSGDQNSNPAPSVWMNNLTLSDISVHRNRLVLAGGENIVFSQVSDFFNFWIADASNIVDADPIDVALSTDEVTLVDFMVSFRKSLTIFTKAGRQFELNAPEVLTPNTAAITPTTKYQSVSIRPEAIGNIIYFAAENSGATILYEYYYDDTAASNVAANITAHVSNILPTGIKSIEASINATTVLVLPEDGYEIYSYRFWWNGNKKEQSAWTKWTFHSSYRIVDIAVIESTCYMLVESGSTYDLQSVSLSKEDADTGWPHTVHLDRQYQLTGVYAAGTTTWTLPMADPLVTSAVLATAFDANSGKVVTVTNATTSVSVAGDYSAHPAILGTPFTMSVELSRPYKRDFNGNAYLTGWLQIHYLSASHSDTGAYSIKATMDKRSNRTRSFDAGQGVIDTYGMLRAWLNGNASAMSLFIENNTPKPCSISSVEIVAEYSPEGRM